MNNINSKKNISYNVWFYFTMLYLFFEFTRIHDLLGIGFVKPFFIIIGVLLFFIICNVKINIILNKNLLKILLFVILLCVLIPFSHNERYAFNIFFGMLVLLPGIISIVMLVDSKIRIIQTSWVLVFIVFFLSVYAITHAGRGPGGIVGDENDLALTLVTIMPCVLFLVATCNNKFVKILLLLVFCIGILALLSTSSRGGFLGFIAMLSGYLIFSNNKFKTLMFLAFVVLFLFFLIDSKFYNEILSITDTTESTSQERIQSWKAGWNMFIDNPLGVGGGNFAIHFPSYQSDLFSRNMWGRQAHSIWFTLLPETGVIGSLFFCSILFNNIKYINMIKKKFIKQKCEDALFSKNLSVAFCSSLLGYLVSASFLSVLYYPHFWIVTAFITASSSIYKAEISNI